MGISDTGFVPTFFLISLYPGMCMTLALSLGINIGYRRTMWMMLGEMVGVAIIAIVSVTGISGIMFDYFYLFTILKIIGSCYLLYSGFQLWLSKGNSISENSQIKTGSNRKLVTQGFITAIANPKGWAFMISLLPPCIDHCTGLFPQLVYLVGIIILSEFVCMSIYATGGKSLKKIMEHSKNIRLANRISGSIMIAIGIWLISI
jgi:threonine/homoserine/homoserine lactone efflux protein